MEKQLLLKCLKDSHSRGEFLAFLDSTFSSESVLFWQEIENFKELIDQEEIQKKAEEIFEIYFQPSSPYEINISSSIVEQVQSDLKNATKDIFHGAQDHIFQMILYDCWPKFKKSEYYHRLQENTIASIKHAHHEKLKQRQLIQINEQLRDPKTGIPLKTKKRLFKSYKSCFSGADLVEWLQKMGVAEAQCMEYGKKLLANNFIQNVQGKDEFKDSSSAFYQLKQTLEFNRSIFTTLQHFEFHSMERSLEAPLKDFIKLILPQTSFSWVLVQSISPDLYEPLAISLLNLSYAIGHTKGLLHEFFVMETRHLSTKLEVLFSTDSSFFCILFDLYLKKVGFSYIRHVTGEIWTDLAHNKQLSFEVKSLSQVHGEAKQKFEQVLETFCVQLFSKTSFETFPSKLRHFAKKLQEFCNQVPKFEADKYRKNCLMGAVIARLFRNSLEDGQNWGLVAEASTFYRDSNVKQNLSFIAHVIEHYLVFAPNSDNLGKKFLSQEIMDRIDTFVNGLVDFSKEDNPQRSRSSTRTLSIDDSSSSSTASSPATFKSENSKAEKGLKSFSKDKIKATIGRTPRSLEAIEARDFAIFLDATVKFRDQVKKFSPENAIPTQKDREFYAELYQQLSEKYNQQQKKQLPKLYFSSISPECKPVLHFCSLNNIKVELMELEMLTGEHIGFDFFKSIKVKELPVLEDNGTFVMSKQKILLYLAEKYYVPDYWVPKDTKLHSELMDLLAWADTKVVQPLQSAFWNTALHQVILYPPKPLPVIDAAVKDHISAYCQGLKELDGLLSKKKFLLGHRISLVDIIVAEALCCEKLWELPFYYSFRNISRWFNLLKKSYLLFWNDINRKFDGFCTVGRLCASLGNTRENINSLFKEEPHFANFHYYFPVQTPNSVFQLLIQDPSGHLTEIGSEILGKNVRKTNLYFIKKVKLAQKLHFHDFHSSSTCIVQFQLVELFVGTYVTVTFLSLPKELSESKAYIEFVDSMLQDIKGIPSTMLYQVYDMKTPHPNMFLQLLDPAKLSEITKTQCTVQLPKFTLFDGEIFGEITELLRDKQVSYKFRHQDWPENVFGLLVITIADEFRLRITFFNVPKEKMKSIESLFKRNFWQRLGNLNPDESEHVKLDIQTPSLLSDEEKGRFLTNTNFLAHWWSSFTLSTCSELTWRRQRASSIAYIEPRTKEV